MLLVISNICISDFLQSSTNRVVRELFEGVVVERGKLAKGSLISNQFMSQLSGLMQLINVGPETCRFS